MTYASKHIFPLPPHYRRMKREELLDGEDGAEFDAAKFAANGPQV